MMCNEIRTAKTETFTMRYFTFGSGEKTLAILPGVSVQSVMLSANAVSNAYSVFKKDFTVYVFDRRTELPFDAYGIEDMAEDTAKVFSILGLSDVYLFGASQGGMIGMLLAVKYPELIKKLAIGSSAAAIDKKSREIINLWIRDAEKGDVKALYNDFGKFLYPEEIYKNSVEVLEKQAGTVTENDLERFIKLTGHFDNFDILERIKKISCPFLAIGSTDDKVLNGESTLMIAASQKDNKDFEYYMYTGYGHAAYDLAPDYKERLYRFFIK